MGRRVRVVYSGECPFCDDRDPDYRLNGKTGRIVSIMSMSFVQHWYEVKFDDGTVLRNVPLHVFGGTIDLAMPNFAEPELEMLGAYGEARSVAGRGSERSTT